MDHNNKSCWSQIQSKQQQQQQQRRIQEKRKKCSILRHHSSSLQKKCRFMTIVLFLMFLLLQPKPITCQQQQQQQQQQQSEHDRQAQIQKNSNDNSNNNNRNGDNNFVTFSTEPFTPNVTHRQNVCDRFDAFRNGELVLRNALQGLTLHPIFFNDAFFNYDEETGIDTQDPGLLGTLLDELAVRAGFTWRNSFGILQVPQNKTFNNVTWTYTDLLVWSVETYDISISWWDETVERLERGVSYTEPWYNGSIILIDHDTTHLHDESNMNFFNWLLPFERDVWILVVATIIISGLIHQLLEYLDDEQIERSLWQWFCDSFYLSWLNFTQNYEYAPNSLSGRIFGISMGVWALVMTATYTANLASLLVEQNTDPLIVVDNIDQAVALGIPICTYWNTNSDVYIKERYASAIRIPKSTELEGYVALQRGECGLVAGYKDSWLEFQNDRRYNPDCDLKWVGQAVELLDSGFAIKADSGYLCTSLIRDVFNLHLKEMVRDQVLEKAWETHRASTVGENANSCSSSSTSASTATGAEKGTDGGNDNNGEEQGDNNSRFLRKQQNLSPAWVVHDYPRDSHHSNKRNAPSSTKTTSSTRNRQLNGGGGGNAASTSTNGSSSSSNGAPPSEGMRLTIHQMAGVFLFHFSLLGVAVFIGIINRYLRIKEEEKVVAEAIKKAEEENMNGADGDTLDTSERSTRLATAAAGAMARSQLVLDRRQLSFRSHGPIIGSPPPINTYIRNSYRHNYGNNDNNNKSFRSSHPSISRYVSARQVNNNNYYYNVSSNRVLPTSARGELYTLSEEVWKRRSHLYPSDGDEDDDDDDDDDEPVIGGTNSCRNDFLHQSLDESPSMVHLQTVAGKLDKSVSAMNDFQNELQDIRSQMNVMMSIIQEMHLNATCSNSSNIRTTSLFGADNNNKKKNKDRAAALPTTH